MVITKIKVENLTVFENLEMDIEANVNVIFGKNGTGKTHLLKFIYAIIRSQDRAFFGLQPYFGTKPQTEELLLIKDTKTPLSFFQIYFDKKKMEYRLYDGAKIDINEYINEQNKKDGLMINASRPVWGLNDEWGEIICQHDFGVSSKELSLATVFIPSKDMITHSPGFLSWERERQISFDQTLIDIVAKASGYKLKKIPEDTQIIIKNLESIIGGKIEIEKDRFFVLKSDGKEIPFDIEAEGMKKIGLIWRLLITGKLKKGSILLWDEPEINIHLSLMEELAKIIIGLSENGIQILITTHNEVLAKKIEELSYEKCAVKFHGLYQTSSGIKCDTQKVFTTMIRDNQGHQYGYTS